MAGKDMAKETKVPSTDGGKKDKETVAPSPWPRRKSPTLVCGVHKVEHCRVPNCKRHTLEVSPITKVSPADWNGGRRTVMYLMRNDLRVHDNYVLHDLSQPQNREAFSHFMPVYVFNERVMDLNGIRAPGTPLHFLPGEHSVDLLPTMGSQQMRFISEAVLDVKHSLEELGSGLSLRAGSLAQVVQQALEDKAGVKEAGAQAEAEAEEDKTKPLAVAEVWMEEVDGPQGKADAEAVWAVCAAAGVPLRLLPKTNTFVPRTTMSLELWQAAAGGSPQDFVNLLGPLDQVGNVVLATPPPGSLPLFVEAPAQKAPYLMLAQNASADEEANFVEALVAPMAQFEFEYFVVPMQRTMEAVADQLPSWQRHQAHLRNEAMHQTVWHRPVGGEKGARQCIQALFGLSRPDRRHQVAKFADERNHGGGQGSQLSPYLVHGCISKRQVALWLQLYESGDRDWAWMLGQAVGFDDRARAAEGTAALRKWLAWGDYYHYRWQLVGDDMFALYGSRHEDHHLGCACAPAAGLPAFRAPAAVEILRFRSGTTGMSYVDAGMRELLLTGAVSQRKRRNIAIFWGRHCGLDWRVGMRVMGGLAIDHDPVLAAGNWQYAMDVDAAQATGPRILHPVQQGLTFDLGLQSVLGWLPELIPLADLVMPLAGTQLVLQPCTADPRTLAAVGLLFYPGCVRPLCYVEWTPGSRKRR